MSIEIFPAFNPDVQEARFDAEGKVLTRDMELLDGIAEELNVTPLSSFADNRPIPDDFDGDPSELDEILGEWDEWFSPTDAIKSAEALIAAIRDDPGYASRVSEPEYIIHDLSELTRCLEIAASQGALFRLEVPI
jgi:hypothetical protein